MERFGALPTVATALGNVTAAGFLLWAFQRAFIAPRPSGEAAQAMERTLPMEYLVGGLAIGVMLLAGWYFETWLDLIEATTRAMALRFGGHE
jgi:NADH-quinone oxidoreductase subunit M